MVDPMTALPEQGNVTIKEVLDCLNHYRLRATYEAVGDKNVVACGTRHVGRRLGKAQPRTSWIVTKSGPRKGLPSEDAFHGNLLLMHPDLGRCDHVIESPEELLAVLTAYRVRHLTGG